MQLKTLLAATAAIAAVSGAAQALTVVKNFGTVNKVETITGSYAYTNGEVFEFKGKILSPYQFTLVASGGGSGIMASGGAGNFADYFTTVGTGTVNYTFTSSVPEPASWALMIVGVGLAGASLRTRARRATTA